MPRFGCAVVMVELSFRIRDQGAGFNWQGYLEMSPERAFDTHGRGIAMARTSRF